MKKENGEKYCPDAKVGRCSLCGQPCGDDATSEEIAEGCGTLIPKKPTGIVVMPMKIVGADGTAKPTTRNFTCKIKSGK